MKSTASGSTSFDRATTPLSSTRQGTHFLSLMSFAEDFIQQTDTVSEQLKPLQVFFSGDDLTVALL